MNVKTSELQGAALDWAVSECEKMDGRCKNACVLTVRGVAVVFHDPDYATVFRPSTDWSQCGPLIEEYHVDIGSNLVDEWAASVAIETPAEEPGWISKSGPTPLIAAYRVIVTAKLGDVVDVPEGLV